MCNKSNPSKVLPGPYVSTYEGLTHTPTEYFSHNLQLSVYIKLYHIIFIFLYSFTMTDDRYSSLNDRSSLYICMWA